MSHFTVMVIGDVDHNLAPFHEFECTGVEDEFVVDVDQTEEVKSDYERHKDDPDYPTIKDFVRDYYGCGIIELGAGEIVKGDEHRFNWAEFDKDDNLVRAVKRTNPNKKWDWYVIGGRWSGFFLGKDGKRHDTILKKDVDIDGMRKEAGDSAGETYDKAMEGVEGFWDSWDECREVKFAGKIEEARDYYNGQEQVKKIRTNLGTGGFFFGIDKLLGGREKYVQSARNGCISTYALVYDRKWVAKGEMGWFGMSDDAVTQDEWDEKLGEFLEKCTDEVRLTVVDCHI